MNIKAVLFDLDGTLIDTWMDLMGASNHVLALHGFENMDPAKARLLATDGIKSMLSSVMKEKIASLDFEQLKKEFLDYYLSNIRTCSEIFDGFNLLLPFLRNSGIRWGIVTNKFRFLTEPLIKSFPELSDCAVTVCNDTVPEKKPHPAPLLYALNALGITAEHALYAGDHIRDIQCGNNAGAYTCAATWGYIRPDDDPKLWNASFVAKNPAYIISFVYETGKMS